MGNYTQSNANPATAMLMAAADTSRAPRLNGLPPEILRLVTSPYADTLHAIAGGAPAEYSFRPVDDLAGTPDPSTGAELLGATEDRGGGRSHGDIRFYGTQAHLAPDNLPHEIGHLRQFRLDADSEEGRIMAAFYTQQRERNPNAYASTNFREFYASRVKSAIDAMRQVQKTLATGHRTRFTSKGSGIDRMPVNDKTFGVYVDEVLKIAEQYEPGTIYMVKRLMREPIFADHPLNKIVNPLKPNKAQ
jgi:hypothetical protein